MGLMVAEAKDRRLEEMKTQDVCLPPGKKPEGEFLKFTGLCQRKKREQNISTEGASGAHQRMKVTE